MIPLPEQSADQQSFAQVTRHTESILEVDVSAEKKSDGSDADYYSEQEDQISEESKDPDTNTEIEDQKHESYKSIIDGINRKIEETRTEKDPLNFLTNHFERVDASNQIQSNQVVPLDQSMYIQVFFNPDTKRANPEIITVQVVQPMLREKNEEPDETGKCENLNAHEGQQKHCCPKEKELTECNFVDEPDEKETKPSKNNPEANQPKNTTTDLIGPQKCVYCREETEVGKFYSCLNCCDYTVCPKCNFKYYVRPQVKKKRALDNLYQSMGFEPLNKEQGEQGPNEKGESKGTPAEQEIKRNRQKHEQLILDTFKSNIGLQNSKNIIKDYAKVVSKASKSPDERTSDKQGKHALQEFVLIGIWRLQVDQWKCYRVFKVDDPVFLQTKQTDETPQRQFIHMGQNNELFYFTKERSKTESSPAASESAQEMTEQKELESPSQTRPQPTSQQRIQPQLLTLDQNDIHVANGADQQSQLELTQAASPQTDTVNYVCHIIDTKNAVEKAERELVHNTARYFQPPTHENLISIFGESDPCYELLDRLLDSNPKTRIQAKTTLQLYDFDGKKYLALTIPLVLNAAGKWEPSEPTNIHIIDLKLKKIVFTIKQASLLLQVSKTSDNAPEVVTYLSLSADIVKVKWQHLLQEVDQPAPEDTSLTQQVFKFRNEACESQLISEQEELRDLFAYQLQRTSFITGCIHKNYTRTTICLKDYGLYQFELIEAKSPNKSSKWCGYMGKDTRFVIDNMSVDLASQCILGEGKNSKGELLKVSGVLSGEKSQNWHCQFEVDGRTLDFNFDDFTIDDTTGKIEGKGSIEGNTFNIREGKLSNSLEVELQLEFPDGYLSKPLFFKGRKTAAKNEIVGKFSWSDDNDQSFKFRMVLSDYYKCEIKIKQGQTFEAFSLKGIYDSESKTIKGCFDLAEGVSRKERKLYMGSNEEYKNFEIRGIYLSDTAQLFEIKDNMHDAQLFKMQREKNEVVQMACGDLQIKENSKSKDGFSTIGFKMVDLDYSGKRDHQTTEVGDDAKEVDKSSVELICKVPTTFQKQGYQLAPFLVKNNESFSFQTQLLFQDKRNRPTMIFLKGEREQLKKKEDNEQTQDADTIKLLPPPQWSSHTNEDFIVTHPILAYKSCAPTDNELIFVNLVEDSPQRVVSIAPFKFVQFVETGIWPVWKLIVEEDSNQWQTTVFMLVELEQKMYLMAYRCFPWPLVGQDPQLKVGKLMLVKGCIDLRKLQFHKDKELGAADFTIEKIKKASLLKRPTKKDEFQIVVALQLVSRVVYFNLQQPDFYETSEKMGSMLPLPTQKGPGNQLYVALDKGEDCSIIYQVTQTEEKELKYKQVYKSMSPSIKAFQVSISETDDLDIDKPETYSHTIYVLEEDASFECIKVTCSAHDEHSYSKQSGQKGQSQKVLQQLFKDQQVGILLQCILERDTISTVIQDPNTGQSKVFVLNERSSLKSSFEPLGFHHDIIMKKKANNQEPSMEDYTQTVFAAEKIPWMNRNIFGVQEANMHYFLIQQNLSSRKLDLMRFDTEYYIHEKNGKQLIIGNHYFAFNIPGINQFMLFKQCDQSFLCALPFRDIEPLTLTEENVQYLLVRYKQKEWSNVLKLENSGRFEPKYGSLIADSKDLVSYILPQNQNAAKKDLPSDFKKLYWILYPKDERLLGQYAMRRVKQNLGPKSKDIIGKRGKRPGINLKVLILNEKSLLGGLKLNSEQQILPVKIYLDELLKDRDTSKQKPPPQNQELDQVVETPAESISINKPFFFLIEYGAEVDKAKEQFRQMLFTADYIVIKIGNTVLFRELSVVFEQNMKVFRNVNFDKRTPEDKVKLVKELLHRRSELLIEFQKVDLQDSGIKIHNVAPSVTAGIKARNMIQITMNEVSVVWDLERNTEVSFMWDQHALACSENFVPTGFTLFKYKDEKKKKQMLFTRDFTQNEDCSLVLSPSTKSQHQHFFRTFSASNLLEIKQLRSSLESGEPHTKFIPYSTYLANFNSLTFFQIFLDQPDFMQLLVQQVKDKQKDQNQDDEEQDVDSEKILIRKLYWTLNMNVIKTIQDKAEEAADEEVKQQSLLKDGAKSIRNARRSLLHCLLLNSKNLKMIEALIKIIKLSSEQRLSDIVSTYLDFENALAIESDEVNKFISGAYLESRDNIKNFQWYSGQELLSFPSSNSLLSQEEMNKKFEAERNTQLPYYMRAMRFWKIQEKAFKTVPVEVMVLEISWVSNNLTEFYKYLRKNGGDENLLTNNLINTLLESQYDRDQLMFKITLPYIAYILICLLYFSVFIPYSITPQHGFFGGPGEREQALLRLIVCLGLVLTSASEIYQIKQQSNYFKDIWNAFYWVSNLLALFICIEQSENVFGISRTALVQLSSLEVMFQWGFAFYWVRLFPQLAFYVNMIQETVKDCVYFILILLASVLMFGNAFYTLQGIPAVDDNGEDVQIWSDAFGHQFTDAAFSSYLIGLGEFSFDNWAEHPSGWLIWIYFILATFFTQIMFFNMLIAIMGSTYEKVTANREKASLLERVNLYIDWYWAITFPLEGAPYLYVMRRKVDDEQEKVASAAEEARQNTLKEICEKQREISKDQKAEQQARLQQQKAMNKRIENLESLNKSLKEKIDLLISMQKDSKK